MKARFYTTRAYEKYLLQQIRGVAERHNMGVDVIDSGAFIVDVKSGAFGVFDMGGKLVKSSLQWRGNNTNCIPHGTVRRAGVGFCDCDAVFLGNAYPHFGHFLIEHLNRAWGMDDCPGDNVKYVFVDNKNIGAKPWLFDFMELLGIRRDDVLILNQSMRFRRVFIPSQSFNNSGRWWAKQFVIPFDKMRDNAHVDEVWDKVYVSRARLPENMRTYGEEKIQHIFEKNGFHIIYPETLPLAQQVAIIGNARVLAGCAGTALHLALFMKPGGHVIQLNRTNAIKDSGVLQYRMCQMKNLDFDVVAASVEEFKSQHGGTHAPQIIGVNENLRAFLDANGFEYTDNDLVMDDGELARYRAQVDLFRQSHGGQFIQKLKKLSIKVIACFVPVRIMRGRVRKWLKEHW